MAHPTLGIDHCFALVNDLEEAADQYRRLGFTLSPRGLHSEAKGSANYTIMFPRDYFELLGLLKDTPLNAPRRAMLDKMGEGLHAIACRIEDAAAGEKALAELGIAAGNLSDFERPVPLPDGSTGRAAFSTIAYEPGEVPRGIVFMCQHRTPETVWLPELQDHANGATGLAAIVAVSEDPAAEAPRFARLWRDAEVHGDDDTRVVETGKDSAPLILMTAQAFGRAYPGIDLGDTAQGAFTVLRLTSSKPDAAKELIEANGIETHKTAEGFAVAPSVASGCVVEFVSG
ncbi:VOC family protein [Sulfitobacter sp. HNIBRBA3233]|uniref:VOC family protein n=1 Tax=Sulfitobacter marinivivus TaxID=3158558 RepID=UPI0032DF373A